MRRTLGFLLLLLLLGAGGCSDLRYKTDEELWTEGNQHFDRGEYSDAIPYYSELARRKDTDAKALLMRGVSNERAGNTGDALSDYASASRNGEVRALLYRVNLELSQGNTASAEADLGKLQGMGLRGRERVIDLALVGTLRLKQHRLRMATHSLERAIQAGQGYQDPLGRKILGDAHYNAAQAYYELGDFSRAYDHYVAYAGCTAGTPLSEQDLLQKPVPTLTGTDYYMLGLLAYLAGDFPAAQVHLSRADPALVSNAAKILDDPSFGATRQRGLR